MKIVVDASVIIAVITNEPEKAGLIKLTENAVLYAPLSVHWEIGNAFSSMFKRRLINIQKASLCLEQYKQIPIRFEDVELEDSLRLADELGIYAYDAYLLYCAMKLRMPLLSLDKKLCEAAKCKSIPIIKPEGK